MIDSDELDFDALMAEPPIVLDVPGPKADEPAYYVASATATQRMRVVSVTDAGKALGMTAKLGNSHVADDLYEGDPNKVPGPSWTDRWNGRCEFMPTEWAVRLKPFFVRIRHAQAVCVSCNAKLHFGETTHGLIALARASDHARTTMNHQIVLLDRDGVELYRAPYRVLGMSW